MADQGKTLITHTVPSAATARGLAISGAGTLSASLKPIGILYDSSASGKTKGQVQIAGTALGTLGSDSITAGTILKSNAAGKLITATGDATDTYLICAVALEGGDDGELVRVLIV